MTQQNLDVHKIIAHSCSKKNSKKFLQKNDQNHKYSKIIIDINRKIKEQNFKHLNNRSISVTSFESRYLKTATKEPAQKKEVSNNTDTWKKESGYLLVNWLYHIGLFTIGYITYKT
jgi:hypothetical protein